LIVGNDLNTTILVPRSISTAFEDDIVNDVRGERNTFPGMRLVASRRVGVRVGDGEWAVGCGSDLVRDYKCVREAHGFDSIHGIELTDSCGTR
jgi:hypothetical protein